MCAPRVVVDYEPIAGTYDGRYQAVSEAESAAKDVHFVVDLSLRMAVGRRPGACVLQGW